LYDWKLGRLERTDISLGTALAASAAFPPFLSPLHLRTEPADWRDAPTVRRLENAERIRGRLRLGDGGIYDNMGIEAIWKSMDRVLVSDAGAPFAFLSRPGLNWFSQLNRVRDVLIDQTRALRKRALIADLASKRYSGAYWGIGTLIADYAVDQPVCTDSTTTQALASIGTRLKAVDPATQERLINWGYALTDAAIRSRIDPGISVGSWPYPSTLP
jgi:NTE family protein